MPAVQGAQLAAWRAAMTRLMDDWCAIVRPGALTSDGAGGQLNAAASIVYSQCKLVPGVRNVRTREAEGEHLLADVVAQTALWTALMPYGTDLRHTDLVMGLRNVWRARTAYTAGQHVMAMPPNGLVYKCMVAGTSGATHPTWPTTPAGLGGIVVDGGVTWWCHKWEPGATYYEIGDYMVPNPPNGVIYKCLVDGTTALSAPAWPYRDRVTVDDGSMTWQVASGDWVTHQFDVLAVVAERTNALQVQGICSERAG